VLFRYFIFTGVNGLLAHIMGSTNMTMEDFDNASRVLHEAVPEEANIVVAAILTTPLATT
jgi:cell division protein FtsZ